MDTTVKAFMGIRARFAGDHYIPGVMIKMEEVEEWVRDNEPEKEQSIFMLNCVDRIEKLKKKALEESDTVLFFCADYKFQFTYEQSVDMRMALELQKQIMFYHDNEVWYYNMINHQKIMDSNKKSAYLLSSFNKDSDRNIKGILERAIPLEVNISRYERDEMYCSDILIVYMDITVTDKQCELIDYYRSIRKPIYLICNSNNNELYAGLTYSVSFSSIYDFIKYYKRLHVLEDNT
jgi:hypothetical protein